MHFLCPKYNWCVGELPYLRDGDHLVAGPWAIIHHLKRKGYNADHLLSKADAGRSAALWQLIESRLGALMVSVV